MADVCPLLELESEHGQMSSFR